MMRYRNYLCKKTEDGIQILQYLSGQTTIDLLAGTQKSLLFDLEEASDGKAESPLQTDPESDNTKEDLENVDFAFRNSEEFSSDLDEEGYVKIPAQIMGLPVTEIGPEAFTEYGAMLSVIEVPSSVKVIREGAFKMCMSLMELRLSEGVERIEKDAISLTPLETLHLPNSLVEIDHMWEMSAICLTMNADHPCYFTDGYGIYQKQKDQEQILKLVYQVDERSSYEVLDGTTVIGENAFAGNSALHEICLPSSVRVISNSSMESCDGLQHINLPEGLQRIGEHAFSRCIHLSHLHFPASLQEVEEHAISDSFGWNDSDIGIRSITVDEKNPWFYSTEDALFYRWKDLASGVDCCAIEKYFGHGHVYDIPSGVTHIRRSAFRKSDCYEIRIPDTVQTVSKEAFRECKNLEWLNLEETHTRLYIPQNPVYRKDEILALLEPSNMENSVPVSYEDLPEKWKKFGRVAISGQKERKAHEDSEFLFDYVGYDGLFHTYLNLTDQIGMACCRLQYPVHLSAEVAERYRNFIENHFLEALEDIALREDLNRLSDFAGLCLFTIDNIEESMEVFNRTGKTKLLGFLMNYKEEHLGNQEFDFSL